MKATKDLETFQWEIYEGFIWIRSKDPLVWLLNGPRANLLFQLLSRLAERFPFTSPRDEKQKKKIACLVVVFDRRHWWWKEDAIHHRTSSQFDLVRIYCVLISFAFPSLLSTCKSFVIFIYNDIGTYMEPDFQIWLLNFSLSLVLFLVSFLLGSPLRDSLQD